MTSYLFLIPNRMLDRYITVLVQVLRMLLTCFVKTESPTIRTNISLGALPCIIQGTEAAARSTRVPQNFANAILPVGARDYGSTLRFQCELLIFLSVVDAILTLHDEKTVEPSLSTRAVLIPRPCYFANPSMCSHMTQKNIHLE